MRRIRLFSIVFFILCTVLFVLFRRHEAASIDKNGPEIAMEETSISVSCEATEEEILSGVTATDKKDGDVSSTLLIESYSSFIETGRRTVTIAAFDSDNNITRATREIVYTDYESPTFSLSQALRFPLDTTDVLSCLSASDILDGNITGNIKLSSNSTIYVYTADSYEVVYSVTNSAGDLVELPVTLTFYDADAESGYPTISLSEYLVYLDKGKSIDPWSYVEEITMDRVTYTRTAEGVLAREDYSTYNSRNYISSGEVTITNPVNKKTEGVYEITYEITDSDGQTGTTTLIVVVR